MPTKKTKKETTTDITKQEKKITDKEEKQKKFLEKLGFAQLVFDFYTAPLT